MSKPKRAEGGQCVSYWAPFLFVDRVLARTGSQAPSCTLSPGLTMRSAIVFTLLGIIFLVGCATTDSSRPQTYRRQVGTASPSEAGEWIRQTLTSRYGYGLDRDVSTAERKYFVTTWKRHTPTEMEIREEVEECRTRLTIKASPTQRTGSGAPRAYRVYFEAEYQVQTDTSSWRADEPPPNRKEYLDEIATYMEDQFKSGVKEY